MAAGRTVEKGRLAHSLHGYFLRAGDTTARLFTKLTVCVMVKVLLIVK
jgi:acyl-CoA thioesterase